MHVFIITQYYPPEIGAAASRWGDFSKILVNNNHKVTVLCEAPHYPLSNYYAGYKNSWSNIEKPKNNLTVIRSKAYASNRKTFFKKIFHYTVFAISAILNFRKVKKFDLLIVSSPPLFTGLVGIFIRSVYKKRFWLDIRDLWPDSALELGQLKKGFLYNCSKKLERKIYESAEGFIFPVPGFKKYLKSFPKIISEKPMIELMNGVSKDFVLRSKSIKVIKDNKFTVLYSGNMGLAQDLETIIKSAELLKNHDIEFRFIGDGVKKTELKSLARMYENKIYFHESLSRDELIKYIKKASVCLVPLKEKKIFESAIPSKMFEYMACEKPIILSVKGEAKKILELSNAGTAIKPENAKLMSKAILSYYYSRDKCKKHGKNGILFVKNNLLKEQLIFKAMAEFKIE